MSGLEEVIVSEVVGKRLIDACYDQHLLLNQLLHDIEPTATIEEFLVVRRFVGETLGKAAAEVVLPVVYRFPHLDRNFGGGEPA